MGQILFPAYYPCGEFISYGGSFYTPLNLDNLRSEMSVYWRVKKWKATITLTPGPLYVTGPLGTFTQYGFWDAETEEDLCCHNSTLFLNDPDDLGSWPASNFFFAFTDRKPYLYFSYSAVGEGRWQAIGNVYDPYYTEGQLTIENFKPETPVISIPSYSSPMPNDGWEATISLSIRAEEYWSYGGTYDTATGQLLK